jgi:hypothetical protein
MRPGISYPEVSRTEAIVGLREGTDILGEFNLTTTKRGERLSSKSAKAIQPNRSSNAALVPENLLHTMSATLNF